MCLYSHKMQGTERSFSHPPRNPTEARQSKSVKSYWQEGGSQLSSVFCEAICSLLVSIRAFTHLKGKISLQINQQCSGYYTIAMKLIKHALRKNINAYLYVSHTFKQKNKILNSLSK